MEHPRDHSSLPPRSLDELDGARRAGTEPRGQRVEHRLATHVGVEQLEALGDRSERERGDDARSPGRGLASSVTSAADPGSAV